jgi:hypothetical protein
MNRDEMGLLRWQWSLYSEGHRSRLNLLIHLLTWPLFLAGTLTLPWGIFTLQPRAILGGLFAMLLPMLAQKKGHSGELTAPAPFRGPLDVVKRFFVEQWITFPRYLLSGEYAKAWSKAQ